MAPGKRETNPEKGRTNPEKGRIERASKTPQTRMDKGFAGCPRVRARKNKKKLLKNWRKTGLKTTVCGQVIASRRPARALGALHGGGACRPPTPCGCAPLCPLNADTGTLPRSSRRAVEALKQA